MAECTPGGITSAAGYAVLLKVNGVQLNGVDLSRVFNAQSPEAMTLSAHVIVQLNAGDIITIEFVPTVNRKRYLIAAGTARLNVKLEPWF